MGCLEKIEIDEERQEVRIRTETVKSGTIKLASGLNIYRVEK